MKIGVQLLIPIGALLVFGANASATTVGWQTWTEQNLGGSPQTANNNGVPYWNNASGDGSTVPPAASIGWCLLNANVGCKMTNSPGQAIPYYGNSDSTAPSNIQFSDPKSTPIGVSLLGINTNQTGGTNGTDYLGWYQMVNNQIVLHPVVASTDAIGSMDTFTPTGQWGWFLHNVQSPNLSYEADYYWFTDPSLNYATGTGVGHITVGSLHFALFDDSALTGDYILGSEDTLTETADRDYNDLIVSFTGGGIHLSSSPEPISMALIGGGLLLCGVLLRKKKSL